MSVLTAKPGLLQISGLTVANIVMSTKPLEPRSEKKRSSGFPTRSDINWAVQPQKMVRGLKFRI